jgi:hypothetical protein
MSKKKHKKEKRSRDDSSEASRSKSPSNSDKNKSTTSSKQRKKKDKSKSRSKSQEKCKPNRDEKAKRNEEKPHVTIQTVTDTIEATPDTTSHVESMNNTKKSENSSTNESTKVQQEKTTQQSEKMSKTEESEKNRSKKTSSSKRSRSRSLRSRSRHRSKQRSRRSRSRISRRRSTSRSRRSPDKRADSNSRRKTAQRSSFNNKNSNERSGVGKRRRSDSTHKSRSSRSRSSSSTSSSSTTRKDASKRTRRYISNSLSSTPYRTTKPLQRSNLAEKTSLLAQISSSNAYDGQFAIPLSTNQQGQTSNPTSISYQYQSTSNTFQQQVQTADSLVLNEKHSPSSYGHQQHSRRRPFHMNYYNQQQMISSASPMPYQSHSHHHHHHQYQHQSSYSFQNYRQNRFPSTNNRIGTSGQQIDPITGCLIPVYSQNQSFASKEVNQTSVETSFDQTNKIAEDQNENQNGNDLQAVESANPNDNDLVSSSSDSDESLSSSSSYLIYEPISVQLNKLAKSTEISFKECFDTNKEKLIQSLVAQSDELWDIYSQLDGSDEDSTIGKFMKFKPLITVKNLKYSPIRQRSTFFKRNILEQTGSSCSIDQTDSNQNLLNNLFNDCLNLFN